jgi:hypothetical protein
MNSITRDIGIVVANLRPKWITADNTFITADNTHITADGGKAPYYAKGSVTSINNALKLTNKMTNKYPLIMLRLPTSEEKSDGVVKYNLNIAIVNYTEARYTEDERDSKVFDPILWPLYRLFMQELSECGLFMWPDAQDEPVHTVVKKYFWGTQQGEKTVKNTFDDPLDALEIIGLKLNQTI